MIAIKMGQKQKIYAISFSFLACLVLVFSFCILPLFTKMNEDSVLLAEKKTQLDGMVKNWEELEQSKKEYQQIKQNLQKLPTFLSSKDALKFIMELENLGQLTGNQYEITIIESKPAATNLDIMLSGTFSSIMKYIIYLENVPYFSTINSFQMVKSSFKESFPGSVIANINISVYHQ